MNGLYIMMGISSLVFVLITYFLGTKFKNKAVLKYIPAIVAALAGIGFYIKSMFFSAGFEDLAYMVLVFTAAAAFLISLVAALTIGFMYKKEK